MAFGKTQNGTGSGNSDTNKLSTALAAYASFYVAPMLYEFTSPLAYEIMRKNYGDDLAGFGLFAHAISCVLVSFFGLKIGIATAITLLLTATGRYGLGFGNILPFAF